jgi:hypothetical protein
MLQKPNYDKGYPTERKPEDKEPKRGKANVGDAERLFGGRNAFRVVSKKGKKTYK